MWSVGASLASGSRELSAACGLSAQVWRVGQEACRWYVVCRGKFVAWVKRPVGGVWSVGVKRASGSKELSAEFGLSGQVWRVGQENCWRSLVCRVKYGEWVKRIVGGVWSVGTSMASGSRGLLAECGLSGRKGRVGQGNCRRVWSVGAKMLRVGQENCWRSVVCRREKGEWVKGIVDGVWSVGSSLLRGSRGLSAGVVCRRENVEWVKEIGGGVWSVGAKRASGSKELSAEFGLSGRKCCVGQGDCRRVWSVGTSMASGSRDLLAACGLSGQDWRVSQRNWRRMWSVGTSLLRGSRGLSLECGLSARKCCVGQRDCR